MPTFTPLHERMSKKRGGVVLSRARTRLLLNRRNNANNK
jgi:hypothetical protein